MPFRVINQNTFFGRRVYCLPGNYKISRGLNLTLTDLARAVQTSGMTLQDEQPLSINVTQRAPIKREIDYFKKYMTAARLLFKHETLNWMARRNHFYDVVLRAIFVMNTTACGIFGAVKMNAFYLANSADSITAALAGGITLFFSGAICIPAAVEAWGHLACATGKNGEELKRTMQDVAYYFSNYPDLLKEGGKLENINDWAAKNMRFMISQMEKDASDFWDIFEKLMNQPPKPKND